MGNSENNDRDKIAERLKNARILSGLSQENAAKLMNLPRPAISEIESGKRKVSAEEIIMFSKVYKVDVSWLLHKDEENVETAEIRIAARELSKMKQEDRNKLLDILKILPK